MASYGKWHHWYSPTFPRVMCHIPLHDTINYLVEKEISQTVGEMSHSNRHALKNKKTTHRGRRSTTGITIRSTRP